MEFRGYRAHVSPLAIYIWVNYNISLTWIKAIWGWFPLLTMIPVRSQWGRYNLPRYIYIYCIYMYTYSVHINYGYPPTIKPFTIHHPLSTSVSPGLDPDVLQHCAAAQADGHFLDADRHFTWWLGCRVPQGNREGKILGNHRFSHRFSHRLTID